MEKMSRTSQRTKLMQALYQLILDLENKNEPDATAIITSLYGVEKYEDLPAYSQVVYASAIEHYDEIKKIISDHLIDWTFARLETTLKALLFVAIAETNYAKVTPKAVSINEAVKIAKDYMEAKDYKFVNAILDKVLL